jgi:signal transduction histidine kinase
LQRWGLREDQLPPGSLVRDKNPSTWQRYRGYILGSGLLCGLETVLIVGLLVQRKRRRQVERWLAERLRVETLCADLSGTFLNLSSNDNVDQIIFYGLQRVTEFLGADRGSLTEFVKATETFRVTHSWAIEGIDPLPSGPIIGQYPWCADTLLRGGIIRCATLNDLPEAAAIDRGAFLKVGTRSVMVVPLTAGNTMLGALSVGTVRAERAWTDEQVQGLRSLGEIYANALLRQRAERAVWDSEALSSAVLASLQGLVAVIDKTGVIIAVNGAWSRFARDHHPNPLASISVGANYLDACRRAAFDNDPRALEAAVAIESVLNGSREEFMLEYGCATPGGEAWYVMSVEQLRRSEGGAVITHRDITDHKRAEIAIQRHYQELAHVSRVAMMGELAVSLAHELNQPLTAILSNAQAAQRFLSAASPALDEVHGILADIVEDDQRAGEVIHRLRGLLKKGEVELLPLNLNQVIQEVIRLLHSDAIIRHVRVELELDAGLPQVWGDRVQLQQVVLNLMLNGFDAMVDRDPKEREMVVRTQQLDAYTVLVAVQDCGSGLETDKLEQIFEPFYTTKVEGLGMGLSICRSIVAVHGGRLWAENNPHRGTTFSFTLPVREALP